MALTRTPRPLHSVLSSRVIWATAPIALSLIRVVRTRVDGSSLNGALGPLDGKPIRRLKIFTN